MSYLVIRIVKTGQKPEHYAREWRGGRNVTRSAIEGLISVPPGYDWFHTFMASPIGTVVRKPNDTKHKVIFKE